MKHLISLIGVLFIINLTAAQTGKFGNTPEDSVECVKNLSLYQEFFKQNNYADALEPWRNSIKLCPKYSISLYINGVKMFAALIKKEKDSSKKDKLIDTLEMIYDQRIVNFGDEGNVLGKKGVDMMNYRESKTKEAFETLKKSFELQGNKSEPNTLIFLYKALFSLYKEGKATKEEMLEWYPKLSEVTKFNMAKAEKSEVKDSYKTAQENLDALFSPVADCPDLIKLYTPKFQTNPNDTWLLETITRIFDKKDCTKEELYFKAATALVKLKPSAEAYYNVGITAVQNNNCNDAIEHFKKSAELAQDDEMKVKANIKVAQCYLKTGQYASVRTYAQKAIGVNPNNGEAYMLIGDAYAASADACGDNECSKKSAYWAAVDKYARAKSVDPSQAENAGNKMASYSKYFPGKESCFFYNITEGSSYTVGCWINENTNVRFSK